MLLFRFNRFVLLSLVVPAFAIIIASGTGLAQVPLREYDTTFSQMLDAIQSKSYDKFVANGDARFRSGFTQKMFEELSQRLGSRMDQGYAASFLTILRQQGYAVYVWKLTFKDGKDDYLVSLFIQNGEVGGFITR